MNEPQHAGPAILGIGASAGGIDAFRGFFEHMPPDSGLGFVVVLHLSPDRKSNLPDILRRWTRMPVVEASEGCAVEPNHVYVPPPGIAIVLRDGHLFLHAAHADHRRDPMPISMFFDSLAAELAEDAIGIVLSGTGSDGALGLKAIKARGGLTLAQGTDGSAPQYGGMPASAIATGAVDIVVPVEAMPDRIMAAQAARRAREGQDDPRAADVETARLAICTLLNRQLGHDFSGYKEKTFMRRVQRRMQVLGFAELGAYVSCLERNRAEAVLLFRDLLIGVTSFFRDSETFDILKQIVLPRLFAGKDATHTIRVWVAGCATGEEAYSLAILMREYISTLGEDAPRVQIFASDIDDSAITTARAGRYPGTLVKLLSPERLERFFLASEDGSYTVGREVRDLCTFSTHSLTRDPPFSRVDLVSCRNLLIYLDTDLQGTVLPAFHYSLVPNGILFLGSSETVSRHESLFTPLDRAHRIFLRRNVPSPPLRVMTLALGSGKIEGELPAGALAGNRSRLMKANRASLRVLERFGPAFVVAQADGEILQYSSRTGRFLEPAVGMPSQNVLDMARSGLRIHLLATIKQAVETGRPVEKAGVAVTIPGQGPVTITLVVEPMRESGAETRYLIIFVENTYVRQGETAIAADHVADADVDQHMRSELRDISEQLQSMTEEHETALEELRSTNEELQSVNEEFQSANEELETSKEEISSINEELQTVNGQLSVKVEELNGKNIDLQNLFESTQVATIFLDPYLVIRSFTPAVASIYNLIPSDTGRPLTDIVSHLRYTDLRADVNRVLVSREGLERRIVRDDGSAHYLMRIQPYRMPNSVVDGTVLTFVDVTGLVQGEEHQRLLVDELNHRVKNMLTVVISMATQTMRRSQTIEQFSKDYLGRVHALTAAYSLLSDEGWQTVSLEDIVIEETKPFLDPDQPNVVAAGPRVMLEPRAALALGMAIHELTTNAVKYGALSVPDGSVNVTWEVTKTDDATWLLLNWIERDGPTVVAPQAHGFGMTLIERGLRQDMSAEVAIEFQAEGVRATLRAPLTGKEAVLF